MKKTTLMGIAFLVSQESKCVSWKVGSVIAKDNRIISTGFNGTPTGHENCCTVARKKQWTAVKDGKEILLSRHREAHSVWSSHNEIHAEINAILFAAKNGIAIDGATMYVTVSPCRECCKAIAQSGIKKLVYSVGYDKDTSLNILKESGIEVEQIKLESVPHITNVETCLIGDL